MPLTHETATALDPQAKAVIDLVIKSGRPPYHHLSPKDARQMFRETRPASTPTPPEIGEVKDLRAEQIPCRVYRPRSEERRVGKECRSGWSRYSSRNDHSQRYH